MDDDEYGDADDVLAALADAQPGPSRAAAHAQPRPAPAPAPPRIQQPTPQRLDRAPPSNNNTASASGGPPPARVVQPIPQALPAGGSGSAILVSPRQKGNPVLACIKSIPWEYSDILADYGLGQTTCALFLSLKYHRLHPEYIYTRIRNLQGKYALRVLLTLVDIPNHEDSLRELSKTSLVNSATVILCWSAAEAARYLELYKAYEHAGFAAIRGQQAAGYAERLVEFVTVPRNVNKADAVALVGSFGSVRNAVNAGPDQVGVVGGWGEKKVRSWCAAVEEPFRARKAARKGAAGPRGGGTGRGTQWGEDAVAEAAAAEAEAEVEAVGTGNLRGEPVPVPAQTTAAAAASSAAPPARKDDQLSDGVAAALARLREKG